MLLGWGAPFTAVQLLFVNVVADGLPGFALGREPAEHGIMDQPPIPKTKGSLLEACCKNRHKRRSLHHRNAVWLLFR